jgi:hypothetical protein
VSLSDAVAISVFTVSNMGQKIAEPESGSQKGLSANFANKREMDANRFFGVFRGMSVTSALTFHPLPRERKQLSSVSGFADELTVNPVL